MLSASELRVLSTFRRFLMTPGQMLCLSGPELQRDRATLNLLIDKDLLVKERFEGGYSLTQTGFATMNECVPHADV